MYGSWYIKHVRQNFLSFWAISSKSKFWKNEKSSRKCFHLHKCTINDNHMIYGSWDINCNRQIFLVIFGFFCPFTPQKWKYHKLKKKKTPGDIIILHKCSKNHGHRLYCFWDMVCAGCNCYFSYWTIFYTFTPLTGRKIKISKNWKKYLEISSFYTNVPKIMIIGYAVPEIWHMMDVIIIFLGYFLPFYYPNRQKNENVRKN